MITHTKMQVLNKLGSLPYPNNKIMTASLKKFKQMIYSKSYEILIRHEKSEITILNETNNKSVYKVYILSKDKKKYYYI